MDFTPTRRRDLPESIVPMINVVFLLLIFFLIPFLIVVGMSFATRTSTAPPFGFGGENPLINLTGYARLFTDTLYIRAFVTSLTNAAGAMVLPRALLADHSSLV